MCIRDSTYGGPVLLDRLRRRTAIPSLLVRCDDDELRLFGGGDPQVTTLPAADKLITSLQGHANTIKKHVLRRRGRNGQRGRSRGPESYVAGGAIQGRKRVIQRRFNVGVLEAIPKRKASTL